MSVLVAARARAARSCVSAWPLNAIRCSAAGRRLRRVGVELDEEGARAHALRTAGHGAGAQQRAWGCRSAALRPGASVPRVEPETRAALLPAARERVEDLLEVAAEAARAERRRAETRRRPGRQRRRLRGVRALAPARRRADLRVRAPDACASVEPVIAPQRHEVAVRGTR